MPKVKQKQQKGVYLNPTQYFCLRYLESVQNRPMTELIEEGLKNAIRYINEEENTPRRPKTTGKEYQATAYIPRDVLIKMSLVIINKGIRWNYSDFVRYGLNRTINSYAERYPDMKKIINKYKEKK